MLFLARHGYHGLIGLPSTAATATNDNFVYGMISSWSQNPGSSNYWYDKVWHNRASCLWKSYGFKRRNLPGKRRNLPGKRRNLPYLCVYIYIYVSKKYTYTYIHTYVEILISRCVALRAYLCTRTSARWPHDSDTYLARPKDAVCWYTE